MYALWHEGLQAWYAGMGRWSCNARDAYHLTTAAEAADLNKRRKLGAVVTWLSV